MAPVRPSNSKVAEYAVEATLSHAHERGEWRLPVETIVDFEALLALHDSQLASAPLHEVLARRPISATVTMGYPNLGKQIINV